MPTLTVTYPVELQTALDRALVEHGAAVVNDLVVNWLKDRQQGFAQEDRLAFQQAFEALDPIDQDQIRVKLATKLKGKGIA